MIANSFFRRFRGIYAFRAGDAQGERMGKIEFGLSSEAVKYIQNQAIKRQIGDAAVEAIRVIAQGCPDPVGVAQSVLKFDAYESPTESSSDADLLD